MPLVPFTLCRPAPWQSATARTYLRVPWATCEEILAVGLRDLSKTTEIADSDWFVGRDSARHSEFSNSYRGTVSLSVPSYGTTPSNTSLARATPSLARGSERQFEMESLGCLEVLDYFKEIAGLRVTAWT